MNTLGSNMSVRWVPKRLNMDQKNTAKKLYQYQEEKKEFTEWIATCDKT